MRLVYEGDVMEIMKVRPYQLMCLVCAFGENGRGPEDGKLKLLLDKIRESPSRPLMLVCNAGEVFSYQDPGFAEDTFLGSEFDRLRDMEILHRLDLMPGAILPAKVILFRIFDQIKSVEGVCGYRETTSDAWSGCPKAGKGYYENAIQNVLVGNPHWDRDYYKVLPQRTCSIITERTEAELAEEKKNSLGVMYQAQEIRVRPHILLCAVEQYADGIRPPFESDNLPEMIQHIIKNPHLSITLAEGPDWMMCAPCAGRDPNNNTCIQVKGHGGLTSQLRDLRVLQVLGLQFGQTMNARELYALIFEKIPTTNDVCTLRGAFPSVWEDICGVNNAKWTSEGKPNESYTRGRALLIEALGISAGGTAA